MKTPSRALKTAAEETPVTPVTDSNQKCKVTQVNVRLDANMQFEQNIWMKVLVPDQDRFLNAYQRNSCICMLSQNAEWVQIAIMKRFHYRDEQCWINRNSEAECFIEPSVKLLWQRVPLCLQLRWLLGGQTRLLLHATTSSHPQTKLMNSNGSDESCKFGSRINHLAWRQGKCFLGCFFFASRSPQNLTLNKNKKTGHCLLALLQVTKLTFALGRIQEAENRPWAIAACLRDSEDK